MTGHVFLILIYRSGTNLATCGRLFLGASDFDLEEGSSIPPLKFVGAVFPLELNIPLKIEPLSIINGLERYTSREGGIEGDREGELGMNVLRKEYRERGREGGREGEEGGREGGGKEGGREVGR